MKTDFYFFSLKICGIKVHITSASMKSQQGQESIRVNKTEY